MTIQAANAMWSWRMLLLTEDAQYADLMERVFYNSMLSAIGLDGNDYFYTNPLRRGPKDVPLLSNDSKVRWTDTTPASEVHCSCCPPNLARTLAQLHTYAYGLCANAVWIHLYGSSRLDTQLPGEESIKLSQHTDYPWDGKITLRLDVPAFGHRLADRDVGEFHSCSFSKVRPCRVSFTVCQAPTSGSMCRTRGFSSSLRPIFVAVSFGRK